MGVSPYIDFLTLTRLHLLQTYVRYRLYHSFLSDTDSINLFIDTDGDRLCCDDILLDGAKIVFPGIVRVTALQQVLILTHRKNKKEVRKEWSVARYAASF